jgi:hypothetical protein
MQVAVADRRPGRRRRLLGEEPVHAGAQAVVGMAGDATGELGEERVEHRRPAPADAVHRAQERLGVQLVEPRLDLDQRTGDTDEPLLEHGLASRAFHDEVRGADRRQIRGGVEHPGRRVAEVRHGVLGRRLPERAARIVLPRQDAKHERPGPRAGRAVEPEREDLRVVAAGHHRRPRGVAERRRRQLRAQVVEESIGERRHGCRAGHRFVASHDDTMSPNGGSGGRPVDGGVCLA